MTHDEIKQVLELHAAWLGSRAGGKRAYLRGAVLRDADLSGAYLRGAVLRGVEIASLRVFTGLYRYEVWAYISTEGIPWVRMGCFYKTVEEWEKIGIRTSNPSEFPDDGSEASEDRVRARFRLLQWT